MLIKLFKYTYFCDVKKSIIFKNTTVAFSDEGKGNAVVLLHGFLENSTMWEYMIPEISKKNRVVTIDLLGHGASDCLGYVHTMELFAETIEAVLKHLKIRKCVLIGHSLGGYVALAFAEKHPEKIKGLCLINSTSNEDTNERKELRNRANIMAQSNFDGLVSMSIANLFVKENALKFKEEIAIVKKEALQTSLQGYIAANEGMKLRVNRNAVLLENSFKKLIIAGEKDPVLDVNMSLMEAAIAGAYFKVLSGGHMSHIESKEMLLAEIISFLKIT